LVILAFAGLGIWLVRELAKYNNTARIIQLVLSGLSFLGSIFSLDVIGLVLGGLVIYALAFDKPTVALFTPQFRYQQGMPIPRY
jgi:hypothetical protein